MVASSAKINIHLQDAGNGTTVSLSGIADISSKQGGNVKYSFSDSIPKVFKSQWSTPSRNARYTPNQLQAQNSVDITYIEGDAKNRYPQRVLFGDMASVNQDMTMPLVQASGVEGKANSSLSAFMAAYEPAQGITDTIVIMMHQDPDAPGVLEAYRNSLSGTHTFKRNGVKYTATINPDHVYLLPESWTGYFHAVGNGEVPYRSSGEQFVVDMGGGTSQTILLSQGAQIDKISTYNGSVLRLAHIISESCSEMALDRLRLLTYLKRDLRSGTFIYGEKDSHTAFNFTEFVKPALHKWVSEWNQNLNRLTQDRGYTTPYEYIFLGGGSFFITEPLFSLKNREENVSIMDLYNERMTAKSKVELTYTPWVRSKSPTQANVLGAMHLLIGDGDWFPETVETPSGIRLPFFATID